MPYTPIPGQGGQRSWRCLPCSSGSQHAVHTAQRAAAPSGSSGTGPLTFAVFNPFSGPDASFGPEQLAGCIPAAAAINAAGGILAHKKIVCKTADSRGDPADAVPAAEQLIATTSSLVGILGPSSDEASATVPLFNRARIPMFGDTGQAVFNQSSFKYFYRITPPDDAVGYAMAVYAHQKGYPTAAAVFGNDISSQGSLPTVVSGFKKLGGKIVLVQKIPLDQSSYRTEVSALIAAHPSVIFTEADPQTSATYLAEVKQLGHLGPFIGTDGTTQPPWLKAVGNAVGAPNLQRYYVGAQPYAPTTGVPYQLWLAQIKAVNGQVSQPASQWYSDSYSMAALGQHQPHGAGHGGRQEHRPGCLPAVDRQAGHPVAWCGRRARLRPGQDRA